MGKLITVSAKVPEELKRRMDELGIKPSKVIREAIEREVRRREVEKLKKMLEDAEAVLARLSIEKVVESIREDRDSR